METAKEIAPAAELTDLPLNKDGFRQVLGALPTGVTIVTTRHEGKAYGMTVSAFCSLSVEPLLVLICINKAARTHNLIDQTGCFGVNILSIDQQEVSTFCARPGGLKEIDRFCQEPAAEIAAPQIAGALAFLDCQVAGRYPGGDHTIFIGSVQALMRGEGDDPLIYFQGGYEQLAGAHNDACQPENGGQPASLNGHSGGLYRGYPLPRLA